MANSMTSIGQRNIRGLLLMLAGIVLLLHTFGFMQQGLTLLLIIISLWAILYGFVSSGMYDLVYALWKRMYSK
jgi:hypothetical protein